MSKEPLSAGKAPAKLSPTVVAESPPRDAGPADPLADTEILQAGGSTPPADDGATITFDLKRGEAAPDETQKLSEGQLNADAKRAATKAPPSAMKSVVIGDYRLLKKLGQGGMGTVFKAHQVSLDRYCAVKLLSKELATKPAFVQRFLREARVMAKLDHQNIVRCFEVGEVSDYYFLSMQLIEGGSVQDQLEKVGKFTIGDALHIVLAVGRALEHAHEHGLIHRDIKPDNVLFTRKGIVKLADLGLAKATDDDFGLTKTGTGAGTPLFMAPEQARDAKHVDGRCDIYALGVMLYVFLTGNVPFHGTTLVEVIEAKEKGKFKPIRSFNADVPERIDLIADKMMAKDPKQRYSSCTEVIAELEGLGLANEQLSFFAAAAAAETGERRVAASAAAPAKTKASAGAGATAAPQKGATKPPSHEEPKIEANIWYWKFTDPKGRPVTKKVTTDEVITLIKNGSMNNKAQLSKTLQGGYRAVGAFSDFETYFRGKIAEKKAGRGAEKYKDMLQQIETEEARRQRWKGLKRLFGRFGSMVGLAVWVGILAGAIVGIWFAFKKFMQ